MHPNKINYYKLTDVGFLITRKKMLIKLINMLIDINFVNSKNDKFEYKFK